MFEPTRQPGRAAVRLGIAVMAGIAPTAVVPAETHCIVMVIDG